MWTTRPVPVQLELEPEPEPEPELGQLEGLHSTGCNHVLTAFIILMTFSVAVQTDPRQIQDPQHNSYLGVFGLLWLWDAGKSSISLLLQLGC